MTKTWRFQAFALALATVAAYLPTLHNGLVWDDANVVDAPLAHAPYGFLQAWLTTRTPDYWPVTSTAVWVEQRLWGLNPVGYHLANLALFLGIVSLLWSVLRHLEVPGAWVGALLFAVHPLNVESVAWAAQQKSLWALLFGLISVRLFIDARHRLSLLAFALAMLSKGSVAMLPFVLLGIVALRRRPTRADLVRLLPFFAVAVLLAAVNVWFEQRGTSGVIRSIGFPGRIQAAGIALWFYLGKCLWPVHLLFVYPQWSVDATEWHGWIPDLTAVAATAVLIWCAVRKPPMTFARPLLAAWLYFCVTLVPVLGLTDVYFMKYAPVADHYAQLGLIGVCALAGAALARLGDGLVPIGRRALMLATVALLALMLLATRRQNLVFRDNLTLFSSTLAGNPRSWMALTVLGMEHAKAGKADEALAEFRRALKLNPDFGEAHNDFAVALENSGRLGEALDEYRAALALEPRRSEFHNDASSALSKLGRWQEAEQEVRTALALQPDLASAESNFGEILLLERRPSEAIGHLRRALELDPTFAAAENNLGIALFDLGRVPDALVHFRLAVSLNPSYLAARKNLVASLKTLHRAAEATEQEGEIQRLFPGLAMSDQINRPFVLFTGATAALGGLLFGFDIAIITGAGLFLTQHFNLDELSLGWAFSSLLFGCAVGSGVVGRLTDRHGRKGMLRWVAVLFALTSLATGLAPTFRLFIAARFLAGLAVGGASILSPMYVAEISPPSLRGRMGTFYQLSIVIGIVASYCINYVLRDIGDWNWRWMFITGVLPSAVLFVLLVRAPETPRYLCMAGREEEAFALLKKILGQDEAEREIGEIRASLAEGRGNWRDLGRPELRRALSVGFCLAILIHFSGINTIVDYAPRIFQSAGFKMDAALFSTFIIGLTFCAATCISFWTIDRFGRRPLYIIGSLGMAAALSLMIVAVMAGRFQSMPVLVLIMAYIAFFSSCIGPVFWTLVPEIFPNKVRGTAMAVPVLTQWVANAVVVLLFPLAFAKLGKAPTFAILAIVCVLQAIFTWFFVPETKQKTLEEIEAFWK